MPFISGRKIYTHPYYLAGFKIRSRQIVSSPANGKRYFIQQLNYPVLDNSICYPEE
jgi:hypothetical protein